VRREQEALETFGILLPPPLFAPRVLEAGDGLLVLEAVEWRSRRQPWKLPVEVAKALGGLFKASAAESDGSVGVTHGDCTPWNLLRTARGWALVDWESTETGVPPFFDPVHLRVQSSVELRRPTKRAVIEGLGLRGWAGARLEAYAAVRARSAGGERPLRRVSPLQRRQGLPERPPRAPGTRRKLFHLIDGTRGAAT
jgi:hypothetical protein